MAIKYDIAQVVYIISNKKQQVFPVQIAEKIQKFTIEGEETSYKVKVPMEKYANQLFELDHIEGEVYTSLENAKNILKEKVNAEIDSMINSASQLAEASFGIIESVPEEMLEEFSILKEPIETKKPEPAAKNSDIKKQHIKNTDKPNIFRPEAALRKEPQSMPISPKNLPDHIIVDDDGKPIGKIGKISGFDTIESRERKAIR